LGFSEPVHWDVDFEWVERYHEAVEGVESSSLEPPGELSDEIARRERGARVVEEYMREREREKDERRGEDDEWNFV
jgi:hypothetical protein